HVSRKARKRYHEIREGRHAIHIGYGKKLSARRSRSSKNVSSLLKEVRSYLSGSRVARLATVNEDGTAQVVPVVFANNSKYIYFVIDKKTKGERLRRIENINRTGRATLLVDRYSEDWKKLSFVMMYTEADILGEGALNEKRRASHILKRKYGQYSMGGYFPNHASTATFVRLTPVKIARWSQILRSSVL
ncbi:MAG: pyridoxamine 5'-phosphate oxidase family protein, partial [Nitrososphaerales archaeon]